MKIYGITFHKSLNYGAFLQAYSLQRIMQNSVLINFYPELVGEKGKKCLPVMWRLLSLMRYIRRRAWKKFSEYNRLKLFGTFRNIVHLQKAHFEPGCIFVAGSDQIWTGCSPEVYFLDFAGDKSRRISYAASLCMAQPWPKPFEQRVLPMLKKFDAISVREESSVPYLTSLGLKNVVCVCDPTILHTGDFYRREFPYERREGDFTFVYRIREEIPESVKSIFCKEVKEVHLQKRRTIVSVTEWLKNIDCAKFVVTDSFHCAVFCILFHKPFLVIPNRSTGKGMNERFSTLLGKTGLEYLCLTCEESHDEVLQKLNAAVDWEKVDAVLEEWRAYSANWLRNALGE